MFKIKVKYECRISKPITSLKLLWKEFTLAVERGHKSFLEVVRRLSPPRVLNDNFKHKTLNNRY